MYVGALPTSRRPVNSDLDNFYTRLLQNGGSISAPSLNIVGQFQNRLRNAGLWGKIIRCNYFVGNDIGAALTPWKISANTPNNDEIIGSRSTPTYTELTGFTANGAPIITGVYPKNLQKSTDQNLHFGIYNHTSGAANTVEMGTTGVSATDQVLLELQWGDSNTYNNIYNSSTQRLITALGANIKGLFCCQRLGTDLRQYRNGVSGASTTVSGTQPSDLGAVTVLAGLLGNYTTSATYHSARRISGYSIGYGLTDGEWAQYSSIVDAALANFGRTEA